MSVGLPGKKGHMAQIYYDDSCDLSVLKGKTIAVIGYGSQGHAQAQNMRDSGLDVIIGLRSDSKSVKVAKEDGFEVLDPAEASKKADIIQVLAPDTIQRRIYDEAIAPNLKDGDALVFSHGFNIPNWTSSSGASEQITRCMDRRLILSFRKPGVFVSYACLHWMKP